jgi:glyoxylase-like metal-dependent hydrolase (beta-lactamase superfamily II)
MSEPSDSAPAAELVAPGLWHWRAHNANIGGSISSCQLYERAGEAVLVDPVPLDDEAWAGLPQPTAVVLTAKCHQRSAWRYRRQFGATVWGPAGTAPMDERPDNLYEEGDPLPAALRPVRTPGPEPVHFCLLAEDGVLFCSDLLANDDRLEFVPLQYHDDPDETRRSVQGLLELEFSILCFDHGPPITNDPKAAISDLLQRTAG